MSDNNCNDKQQQQNLIRYSILYEFKLERNHPLDICENIQKIFGYNSETCLNTIQRWFKQFRLGDESLDYIPDERGKRPNNQLKSLSAADSTPPNDTQTKLLLWQLKDQVDLLYRKINAQDCCLQLADRFLKHKLNKPKKRLSTNSQDDLQKYIEIFCKKYRFLRRKCRKLHNKINSNSSFYEILYDSLYPCDKRKETKKKKNNNTKKKVKTPKFINNKDESLKDHIKDSLSSLPNSSIADQTKSKQNSRKTTKLVSLKTKPSRPKSTQQNSLLVEEQPIACDKCGKFYKSKKRLMIHVKCIHELTERSRCSFEGCKANYALRSELNRHIKNVHSKDARVKPKPTPQPVPCDKCDKVYKSKKGLRKHVKHYHELTERSRCSFEGCTANYAFRYELNRHIKNVHSKEAQVKPEPTAQDTLVDAQQPIACDKCGKFFKNKKRLLIHVKCIHELTERSRCSFEGCKANYALRSELNRHIKNVHSKEAQVKPKPIPQPVTCDQCGKVLNNKKNLRFHVKQTHERTEPFKCPFEGCTSSYAFHSQIYHHTRVVHHKNAYSCPDCSFATLSLYMYRKHRSVHRNEADKYRCPDCSYASFSPVLLRRHTSKHTDHRPHKCIWPGCDQSFKSASCLIIHRKFHENQREYNCQLPGCESTFNTKCGLNRHLMRIHQLKLNFKEKIDHDQFIKVES